MQNTSQLCKINTWEGCVKEYVYLFLKYLTRDSEKRTSSIVKNRGW